MGQTLGDQNPEPGSSRETRNLFPLEINILGVEDGGSSSPLISIAPNEASMSLVRLSTSSSFSPLRLAGERRPPAPRQQLDVRRSPERGARGREGTAGEGRGGAESARGLGQCGGVGGRSGGTGGTGEGRGAAVGREPGSAASTKDGEAPGPRRGGGSALTWDAAEAPQPVVIC